MTKHCNNFSAWTRRLPGLIGLMLATGLWAQGNPPNFTPPSPPSFTPPAPPPGLLDGSDERQAQARNRPASEPARDPFMEEVVGLIRISDLNTNEVLQMLQDLTAKPILRQQNLPNVVINFTSKEPLTRREAISAIESLLALNGIAITTLGDDFLKAVPSAIVTTQVPPLWEGTTLNAEPTQKIYEKLFRLNYLAPEEAVPLLQPLMSQGAPLSYARNNLLLITDALVNLQRLERLLREIDQPATPNVEMRFFELQNISAGEAMRRLQEIQQGPLARQLQNNTTFSADERTNQLLVFTHPGNLQIIEDLVERFDLDVAPLTRTRIYNIRYAEAPDVVELLEQIVTGQKDAREAGENSNTPAARSAAQQRAQQNQQAAAVRAEATNLQFSDFLTLVPDERANTILASGTENDHRFLEQLINEIDVLLAQVRIEVVVTDVTLSDDDSSGIGAFGIAYNDLDGSGNRRDDILTINPNANEGDSVYGVRFNESLIFNRGSEFGLDVIFSVANQDSNVSVLSAPTIVTTHNREASISIGQQRPVLTSSTTNLDGSSNITNQVQFRDINLEVKVKPLIGSDGVIQLEVEQTFDTIAGTVQINGNEQPIIGTRRANSYVSVPDGGLVVLGGLQQNEQSQSEAQNPLLGRIPLINQIFKQSSDSLTRSELLIFIRPTIIRTVSDINNDAQRSLDTVEEGDRVRDFLERGTFRPEEEPPAPERPDGLPRRNK